MGKITQEEARILEIYNKIGADGLRVMIATKKLSGLKLKWALHYVERDDKKKKEDREDDQHGETIQRMDSANDIARRAMIISGFALMLALAAFVLSAIPYFAME